LTKKTSSYIIRVTKYKFSLFEELRSRDLLSITWESRIQWIIVRMAVILTTYFAIFTLWRGYFIFIM